MEDAREPGKNKRGGEIIRQGLRFVRAIGPRSVGALPPNNISRGTHRPINETRFARQLTNSGQRFSRQQTRIEDPRRIQWRVAEANFVTELLMPLKIVENEVADSARERYVLVGSKALGSM